MRESGCQSIAIGIESADPDVFEAIKKGETLQQIKDAVRLAKNVGIRVTGFFMVGLPHATFQKDLLSIKLAKRLRINAVWNIFVPYPHTQAWEWVNRHGRILGDWRRAFHVPSKPIAVFETPNYTARERIKAYYKAIIRTGGLGLFSVSEKSRFRRIRQALQICWRYDKRFFISLDFFVFVIRLLARKLTG
jgi:radical SAM superfamily enzyme YgiQ (UPF0313 family)